MTYGIICAMPEEFGVVEDLITGKKITKLFSRDFIEGKINSNNIVATISRIGKVAAAMTTTLMIEHFKVDKIIFCGIAGGLSDNINIGDIVIGSSCVQHDFYLSDNDIFRIPLLNISSIPCDKELSYALKNAATDFSLNADNDIELKNFFDSANIKKPDVFTGVIASGDQFISSSAKKNWIKEKIENVLCVEMEGAAVAQVCYEAGIPCGIVRVISDGADENADVSFDDFVSAASLYSKGILKEFFK